MLMSSKIWLNNFRIAIIGCADQERIDDNLIVKIEVAEMDTDQQAAFKAMARDAKSRPRLSRSIKNVIAVMSGKGGVGKSSVAVLSASALQRRSYKVGVLMQILPGHVSL